MTVLDFTRAYIDIASRPHINNLRIQRSTNGVSKKLYSGSIDDERYMRSEVMCAKIRRWFLAKDGSVMSVVLIVE